MSPTLWEEGVTTVRQGHPQGVAQMFLQGEAAWDLIALSRGLHIAATRHKVGAPRSTAPLMALPASSYTPGPASPSAS